MIEPRDPIYVIPDGIETRWASPENPSGEAGEYGLFERSDDWSNCAYFYLDRPENDLGPLPGVETRSATLYDGAVRKDGED